MVFEMGQVCINWQTAKMRCTHPDKLDVCQSEIHTAELKPL